MTSTPDTAGDLPTLGRLLEVFQTLIPQRLRHIWSCSSQAVLKLEFGIAAKDTTYFAFFPFPISSGEIESAHRYVIQQRLKRSGSWWAVKKAADVLVLRVLRENQDWHAYRDNLSINIA